MRALMKLTLSIVGCVTALLWKLSCNSLIPPSSSPPVTIVSRFRPIRFFWLTCRGFSVRKRRPKRQRYGHRVRDLLLTLISCDCSRVALDLDSVNFTHCPSWPTSSHILGNIDPPSRRIQFVLPIRTFVPSLDAVHLRVAITLFVPLPSSALATVAMELHASVVLPLSHWSALWRCSYSLTADPGCPRPSTVALMWKLWLSLSPSNITTSHGLSRLQILDRGPCDGFLGLGHKDVILGRLWSLHVQRTQNMNTHTPEDISRAHLLTHVTHHTDTEHNFPAVP